MLRPTATTSRTRTAMTARIINFFINKACVWFSAATRKIGLQRTIIEARGFVKNAILRRGRRGTLGSDKKFSGFDFGQILRHVPFACERSLARKFARSINRAGHSHGKSGDYWRETVR